MIENKKTVTLDSGLTVTVDLAAAATPEARRALHRNDRRGDPFGLLDFLVLAIGDDQLDALIASLRKDGKPGTDADLAAAVRDMVDKLGVAGKKS